MVSQTLSDEKAAKQNKQLAEISKTLYGKDIELRIVRLDSLCKLRRNARFFQKEVFKRLVENIQNDKALASVPLVAPDENGALEILSGNHRVMAAIEAGLEWIMVLVLLTPLTESHRLSIALSHNRIVGQDDPQILNEIWKKINTVDDQLYSGFDSNAIQELVNSAFSAFSAANIQTEVISFWFLPEQAKSVNEILAKDLCELCGEIHAVSNKDIDLMVETILKVKKNMQIKNSALSFSVMVRLANERLEQILEEKE